MLLACTVRVILIIAKESIVMTARKQTFSFIMASAKNALSRRTGTCVNTKSNSGFCQRDAVTEYEHEGIREFFERLRDTLEKGYSASMAWPPGRPEMKVYSGAIRRLVSINVAVVMYVVD